MTVCNMSIEAGAKAGLIAPDDTTFAYLEGRAHAPEGRRLGGARSTTGARLPTDEGATFDQEVVLDAAEIAPARLLGHQPRPGRRAIDAGGARPRLLRRRQRARRRPPGAGVHGPHGRHAAARRAGRHRVHRLVHQRPHRGPAGRGRGGRGPARCSPACGRWSCPGSFAVKDQAEAEGLDRVFTAAGFDWREPGCSMCLAMNPDKLAPGERCGLDLQPQLRGPPGQGRAHPPGLPRGRRRHRHRRPLRRPPTST